MKLSLKLLFAAAVPAAMCSLLPAVHAQTLLAGWAVNSLTGTQTTAAATTASANITVGSLTKGAGISPVTTSGVFGGNNWINAGGTGVNDTEAYAIAGGHYLTYTVQASPGYTVSFATNILFWHNSATGPWNGELQYSTDGINYTDVAFLAYNTGNVATTAAKTNVLSGVAALQNVPSTTTNYFRLVNWGATGSGGTWYVNNASPATMPDFQVIGSVTAAPPAENLATWWVNGITGNVTNSRTLANNTSDPNVIIGPLTKGAGLGTLTTTAVFGGNAWTNAGVADSEANSILNGLYVTYTVQAAAGYTVSFYTNLLWMHASSTGPHNGVLQYSTDGANYTDLVPLSYGSGTVSLLLTNNLSGFNFLQNVPATVTNFFRIVNWGATGAAGTWYVYDNPAAGTPLGTNDFAVIGGVYSLNGVVAPTNLVVSATNLTVNAGQTVSFSVTSSGSAASNFWYQTVGATTTLLPNATASTLTLSSVLGANTGNYFAVLTNASGAATSSIVSLTVIDPILQVEPASVEGLVNGTVQFAVAVAGSTPAYQWYYSDLSGNAIAPVSNGTQPDTSVISGATSSTLTLANLQAGDATNFVVIATNPYGAVTSTVASFLAGNNPAGGLPYNSSVLALWNFDGAQFTNTAANPNCLLNPVPFIGAGTAAAAGSVYVPGTSPFAGATDPNDVGYDAISGAYVFTPYGFEQPSPNFSWGTEDYPAVTGTNKANGVQFNVSTAGAKNIQVAYDSRVSSTASDYERLQYTTNGTDWIDYPASSTFSGLYGSGNAGYHSFSYSLVGFPGVDNNPNFGIRVVTEWQSTATYGIGATNFWVGTANSYTSGASGNNAGGTVTYDLVAVLGDAITNHNTPPGLSAFMNTNMVDTNTLTLNFSASSAQMDPAELSFAAQPVDTVAAGVFTRTVNPALTVVNTGGTNFQLIISFQGSPVPDAVDAAPILVTATDTNGESTAAWFVLTAGSVNQPPTNTLTAVSATNTLANTALTIPFTVGSARDGFTNLTFSVASDNNTVMPVTNILVSADTNTGSASVTLIPATNQVGNALISITVNDNDPAEPRSTTASLAFVVRPNTNVVAVDNFNYDGSGSTSLDGVAASYWQHLSGINGQLQVVPGTGAIVDTADNTENLQAKLLNGSFKTNSGTVLYSSLVVNLSSSKLPTVNGSYFAAFNDGSGNTANVEDCLVAATNGAALGYYRLGIGNAVGATAASARMFPVDLLPGSNYVVVTALAVSNGFSTLWVNPTNPSSQHVTDTTAAASPTNLFNISDFELRESGATAGSITVSSVAVGLSFNSVFYPAQANGDNFGVTENTTNVLSPLANDAGWGLSIISLNPDANGMAAIIGTNLSFIPASNFIGTATIGYTVQDNLGNTSSATITVTVTNRPPLASPDSYTVLPNSVNNVLSPLANDVSGTPGGSLSLVSVSPDANGAAVISGTNVIFTPAADFTGVATVGYTVTDNIGGTSSAVISVTVGYLNPPPLNAVLASQCGLVLSWTNALFSLQTATNVAGPYVTLPGPPVPTRT